MKKNKHAYILYTLSLAGFLFSGYLSSIKFFTNTCAFGETCPAFFGKPACYFGFALFLILFALSASIIFRKSANQAPNSGKGITNSIIFVSALGIIFAGNFVYQEFARFATSGFAWSALGLPTCAYGLIFYMLVLVFALRYKKSLAGGI